MSQIYQTLPLTFFTMSKLHLLICAFACTLAASAAEISGTLPVLYIETENHQQITSKEDYISATYYLDPMGIDGIQAFGTPEDPLTLQIRGRGNYTWIGFDKKPYRLKLSSKAALLGMKKSKHFVLLAGADDTRGFMRNIVGFQLSRQIGLAWTPTDVPCELVLNGSYEGLYFLTENIRVDSDRVNIVEQADEATDPTEITGGWLMEIDNYDTDPHVEITEGDGERIIFTYKTPEILSTQQADYLVGQMTTINNLIYDDDKNNCQWAEYIDLHELAKFYIVQELTDNYESFHGSCYMYKEIGDDSKWRFGPVWDFGSALTYKKTQPFYEGREHHNTWIPEMCKFPEFMQIVKEEWLTFYPTAFSGIYDYIDEYTEKIRDAAVCDYQRWPAYGAQNLQSSVNIAKYCLRTGEQYMCELFGPEPEPAAKICVYFHDDDPNPWNQVYVYSWDPEKDNKQYFGGWPGAEMTPITYQDKQMWSCYFELDETPSANTGLIFGNGDAGGNNQTGDLILVNEKIYNRNGIIGDLPAGIETIDDTNDATPEIYYNLQGVRVTNPTEGFYIVRKGNKVSKRIVN